jgi:hypothetical protein
VEWGNRFNFTSTEANRCLKERLSNKNKFSTELEQQQQQQHVNHDLSTALSSFNKTGSTISLYCACPPPPPPMEKSEFISPFPNILVGGTTLKWI